MTGKDYQQGEILKEQVLSAIATRFASCGLDDLEAVIDPLFMKSKTQFQVEKSVFKQFVYTDMQTNVNERDLDLFLLTSPILANKEVIHKTDLLSLFEEPFRVARYSAMQSESVMRVQRSQMETIMGKSGMAMPSMNHGAPAGGLQTDLARFQLEKALTGGKREL